jgi:hypothetical protein
MGVAIQVKNGVFPKRTPFENSRSTTATHPLGAMNNEGSSNQWNRETPRTGHYVQNGDSLCQHTIACVLFFTPWTLFRAENRGFIVNMLFNSPMNLVYPVLSTCK